MADNFSSPSIPLSGAGMGQQGNPWFTVANQFVPRNLHDVIRWSRYITLQSPTTSEVIRKYATYPVTEFIYDTKGGADIETYRALTKSLKLKEYLQNVGFEYFTLGNVFCSVYFPHIRMVICPTCRTEYNIKKLKDAKYRKHKYTCSCAKCDYKGPMEFRDEALKDPSKINLINWTPENIIVNHNPITGEYDYYYRIPNNVKQKVLEGDRLFVDGTPLEFLEAIRLNQDFKFNPDSIFHLKNVTTGSSVNGISIPPLISLFSLVFYQATLRKANEAIATEYLNPLRVVFPQASTTTDPLVSASLRNFVDNMETAFKKHKIDKNYVLVAPTPVGYTPIGGEGRNLLVAQEIQQAEESILMSLGVSRELLSGITNWTSSTVGLRMLENLLTGYVGRITDLMEWILRRIAGYMSYNYVPTSLEPFRLLDDDNLKSLLSGLTSQGIVSETTFLNTCGINFQEEQEHILAEKISKARQEIKTQFEVEKAQYLESLSASDSFRKEDTFKSMLEKAQTIAEQLFQADEGVRRSALYKLKTQDYATYLMVAKLLDDAKKDPEHQEEVEAQGQEVAQANEEENAQTPGAAQ